MLFLEKNMFNKGIHFIGIGGVGMSALASLLIAKGCNVSGSDLKLNKMTQRLKSQGAEIFLGHSSKNIDAQGLVVYSSCIKKDNPEIVEAKRQGIKVAHRAALLAALMSEKRGIAVAGTHGKTTTTSMIALVLEIGNLQPSFAIGADVDNLGGNACLGQGEYFVAEADESDGSMVELKPYYSVITNIEREHLDYYKDLEHIVRTFENFISNTNKQGALICFCDDENIKIAINNYSGRVITYGFKNEADIQAFNIRSKNMKSVFECRYKGQSLGDFSLNVPGVHNVLNSLAAICLGIEMGLDKNIIRQALDSFTGADRRFQIKNINHGIIIVDDYAHHPTEIRATLEAARAWGKRVVGVFQPHRYSRTKFLQKDFGSCFESADHIVITDIYAANETPIDGVGAKAIYEEVKKNGHKNVCFLPREKVKDYLLQIARDGDMLMVLGAGDIGNLAEELSQIFSSRDNLTCK